MFATAPGQIAYDGIDGHSLFAGALLKRMADGGIEVRTAFQHVIDDVSGSTFKQQTPQIFSSLGNDFYFRPNPDQQVAVNPPVTPPAPTPPATPPAQPQAPAPVPHHRRRAAPAPDPAQADFEAARHMGTVRGWQQFLFLHPADGDITGNARGLLVEAYFRTSAGMTPARAETVLGASKALFQRVQQALDDRGYNIGRPDGVPGAATRRALADLQKQGARKPTGYLDPLTLGALNIPIGSGEAALQPGWPARTYRAEDLLRLEGDPRLSSAVRCLGDGQIDYGYFGGHLYVALAQGKSYDQASQLARRCGGYLASITSKAENDTSCR